MKIQLPISEKMRQAAICFEAKGAHPVIMIGANKKGDYVVLCAIDVNRDELNSICRNFADGLI